MCFGSVQPDPLSLISYERAIKATQWEALVGALIFDASSEEEYQSMTDRVLPKPARYASCPYDGRILEYYKGQFDNVFLLLHPFLSPRGINIKRFSQKNWPSNHDIIKGCEAVPWEKILELTNMSELREVDIGLRTSIGGLRKELENEAFAIALEKLTEKKGIIHPSEGEFPPLVENRIYEAIKALGHEWLWVGDEFCTERKLHWIDDLMVKDEVPSHGCLFTHDHSLLVTTYWDSHCSFLCSSTETIEQILDIQKFEGFYCTEKTEVYWGVHEI